MRRAYLLPAAILLSILAFSVWNGARIGSLSARWENELRRAEDRVLAGDLAGAQAILRETYDDWTRAQTYLHVVAQHSAISEAETAYRRAAAFAEAQDETELRAELRELQNGVRLLAERERLTVRNVF